MTPHGRPNDFSQAGLPVSPGQLPPVAPCNTSQAWPPKAATGGFCNTHSPMTGRYRGGVIAGKRPTRIGHRRLT